MERNAHKEPEKQPNNPLHGKTLEAILVFLVSYYGWEELGDIIHINSFRNNPSLKSSLKFLRKTPWAREKVEKLYVDTVRKA
ncbi:VF530 family protein [Draconibacterium sp. IB214405]|uniref:VF530 family protein n=1 Tax=Draconibacterium sp. IB214405 TaxID=3097352 RepID=UPI002A0F80C2|nr:VF530 family protein [Draconibacterium sp. IB214405]MDX8340358.1 VF530 family protein [Draconibacterium sp. IB214405]